MDSRKPSSLFTEDDETRSLISMQELEPSPVDDLPPDLESGGYFPKADNAKTLASDSVAKLGLSGHGWIYWCTSR
jgi:tRNA (guanine26-N2/guanine27-N2)-dimethyltransferase